MKTPEEILAEREAVRKSGRLAHTPNGRGEFYARIGCLCYTCRDQLDPTGEEDAKAHNDALMLEICAEANIPPPPPTPVLKRQNAICVICLNTHENPSKPCVFEVDPDKEGLAPTATEPLRLCTLGPSTGAYDDFPLPTPFVLPRLPPPPHIATRQPSAASSGGIISPLVGIMTPRSGSEASGIEDRSVAQEKQLVVRLKRMLRTYQQLQEHIDQLNDHDTLKHDEMAAYDAWWNEVDGKILAVENLLKVLEE